MRTIEIQVILHTDNGDVVTTYGMKLSQERYSHLSQELRSHFNKETTKMALDNFRNYVEDGKNCSMKTVQI